MEYYFQTLEGEADDLTNGYAKNPTLAPDETKTGTTDTEVSATVESFEGFTFNTAYDAQRSGVVQGDGSLVLRLYYTRNVHHVRYTYTNLPATVTNPDPSVAAIEAIDDEVRYGAEYTPRAKASFAGYDFIGWWTGFSENSAAFPMPDRDVTLHGTFKAGTHVPYSAVHYLEVLTAGAGTVTAGGKHYKAETTDTLYGETEQEGTAPQHSYNG